LLKTEERMNSKTIRRKEKWKPRQATVARTEERKFALALCT
jgi:hypothetical protein